MLPRIVAAAVVVLVPTAAAQEPDESAARRFELDHDDLLRGRIVLRGELPPDESLEVIVSAWSLPPPPDDVTDPEAWALRFLGVPLPYEEVFRGPVRDDGSFAVPRVVGATDVRVDLGSDHVRSTPVEFGAGSPIDRGDRPIRLRGTVAGYVELNLVFPDDATDEERASLIGRELRFDASRRDLDGRIQSISIPIEEGGIARWRRATPLDFRHVAVDELGGPTRTLEPFVVPLGFWIAPVPGQRRRIDVPLSRGVRLDERIVVPDGSPVVAARVGVRLRYGPTRAGSAWFHATTDERGRVSLLLPPDPVGTLSVVAPDVLPLVLEGAALEEHLAGPGPRSLRLEPGAALHARVTVPDGRPVAGLEVTLAGERVPGHGSSVLRATTGPDGRVVILGVTPGAHVVRSKGRTTGAAGAASTPVTVRTDGHQDLDDVGLELRETCRVDRTSSEAPVELVALPGRLVNGRLLPREGLDLSRCRVFYTREDSPADPRTSDRVVRRTRFAEVASDGTFRFLTRSPGRHVVQAKSIDLLTVVTERVAVEVGRDVAPIELGFLSSASVAGRVVDASGAPVPDVDVVGLRYEHSGEGWRGRATAGPDGAFRFDDLEKGRHLFFVAGNVHVSACHVVVDLRNGEARDDVDVATVRGGRVEVTLLGSDGAPLFSARPEVRRLDGASLLGVGTGATDAGGSCVVGPIAPGRVRVGLRVTDRDGTRRRVSRVVDVRAGGLATVVIDGRDVPGSYLVGRVTSGDDPANGYALWLRDEVGFLARTSTDAEGRFRLPSEADGTVTLAVHAGDGTSRRVATRTVELVEGAEVALDIDLPTSAISGRVRDRPSPLERMGLRVVAIPDGLAVSDVDPSEFARVDRRGSFELLHLAAGRYRLGVLHVSVSEDEPAVIPMEPEIVQVRTGELRDVTLIAPR